MNNDKNNNNYNVGIEKFSYLTQTFDKKLRYLIIIKHSFKITLTFNQIMRLLT